MTTILQMTLSDAFSSKKIFYVDSVCLTAPSHHLNPCWDFSRSIFSFQDRDIAAWEEVIDGVMDMDMDKALEGVEIISTPTLPTPTEPTPTLPEIPSSPSVGQYNNFLILIFFFFFFHPSGIIAHTSILVILDSMYSVGIYSWIYLLIGPREKW